MKKILLILALLIGFTSYVGAQTQSQIYTLSSYADTISGADIHYYTFPNQIKQAYLYGVGVYSDHISGSADSAYVTLQGSIDKTNYFDIKTATYAQRLGDADAATSITGADVNAIILYPYVRVKIQHYVTGTARYKVYLWLFKR